jgi:hypothetical protein
MNKIKRLILGIFIGAVILVLFVIFGGAKYVRIFGAKTEEAGIKLEKIEKQMKKSAEEARKKAAHTAEGVKETIEKTTEKVKELVP